MNMLKDGTIHHENNETKLLSRRLFSWLFLVLIRSLSSQKRVQVICVFIHAFNYCRLHCCRSILVHWNKAATPSSSMAWSSFHTPSWSWKTNMVLAVEVDFNGRWPIRRISTLALGLIATRDKVRNEASFTQNIFCCKLHRSSITCYSAAVTLWIHLFKQQESWKVNKKMLNEAITSISSFHTFFLDNHQSNFSFWMMLWILECMSW